MPLLEVESVVAGYNKQSEILKGVSLSVGEGQMVSIIGPNGAGKSTVLKAIFGLLKCRSGKVAFADSDLTRLTPRKILQRGMCFVPQGRNVFPEMTVIENLRLGAYTRKDRRKVAKDIERVEELFPILRDRRGQLAGYLSGGEQQMLEMGRAMLLSPKLLLVDEPSMGLSPKMVGEVFNSITEIRGTGTSVLIVEQNADASLRMSDYAYVLELGCNKQHGSAEEIRLDPAVRRAYLGM